MKTEELQAAAVRMAEELHEAEQHELDASAAKAKAEAARKRAEGFAKTLEGHALTGTMSPSRAFLIPGRPVVVVVRTEHGETVAECHPTEPDEIPF